MKRIFSIVFFMLVHISFGTKKNNTQSANDSIIPNNIYLKELTPLFDSVYRYNDCFAPKKSIYLKINQLGIYVPCYLCNPDTFIVAMGLFRQARNIITPATGKLYFSGNNTYYYSDVSDLFRVHIDNFDNRSYQEGLFISVQQANYNIKFSYLMKSLVYGFLNYARSNKKNPLKLYHEKIQKLVFMINLVEFPRKIFRAFFHHSLSVKRKYFEQKNKPVGTFE